LIRNKMCNTQTILVIHIMHKHDQDDLYLIVDFLEQQLELHQDMYGDEFEDDKEMLNKTAEVIKSLIKE
jgi:hypothetical protein